MALDQGAARDAGAGRGAGRRRRGHLAAGTSPRAYGSAAGTSPRAYGSAEEAAAATFAGDTTVVDALAEHAATMSGLVVVVEDLQWADQATLRLLERVTTEVRRLPLLVLATVREGAGGSLPGALVRNATDVRSLGPLTLGEAAELLTAAVERADPDAVRHAARLSGGSPLYLRTLSRTAADQLRGRAAWDEEVGEAPELRHLIAAAMRAAGSAAGQAVEALSVLGPEAEPEVLARLIEAGPAGAAVERLHPAVPAGLLAPLSSASGRIRFAHALVREAVYASLPPVRRAALHRRAAELLEPLAVARDERAGAVAHHWYRAGEPARAVGWAVRAADAARAAAAYEEAVSYLELALTAIDRGPADAHGEEAGSIDRAELLLDLARMQYLAGRIRPSVRTSEQAAGEGERTGRAQVVARAALVVQGIGNPEVNGQIERTCRRALAMLGEESAPDLRARVQAQLACSLLEAGDVDGATRWSRRALADAAASGDPDAELDAIRARADLVWQPGYTEEVVELGRRAIELAEQSRRPLAKLWGSAGTTRRTRSTSHWCTWSRTRKAPWPLRPCTRSSNSPRSSATQTNAQRFGISSPHGSGTRPSSAAEPWPSPAPSTAPSPSLSSAPAMPRPPSRTSRPAFGWTHRSAPGRTWLGAGWGWLGRSRPPAGRGGPSRWPAAPPPKRGAWTCRGCCVPRTHSSPTPPPEPGPRTR
ncbi:hypothetical protein [Dactylosporangium sp. CA-139066]|uniref:hypothetical protein n=1 Tax=Dactylosporangium sp. CA-139066 TaxID=3239930 RepID=UPI003D903733